ncbi:MAG: serine/threonine protein kinase, partial [Planctomycetota bacterium]
MNLSDHLPRRIGSFEILREIGQGAMGKVYLGNGSMGKVAIKVLKKNIKASLKAEERFKREMKILSQMDHPHIIKIYEVGEDSATLYYAMEYIDGMTLKEKLYQKKFTIKEALLIILQIARGLAHAHELDIIHRDLKPANIMLNQEEKVKVTDFGLAKELSDDSGLTRPGGMVGSPKYMSPEQLEGLGADFQSDIYSLGVIFFELLTGRYPYEGDGVGMIYAQILDRKVPSAKKWNPSIPFEVERICRKAMAKDKTKRYSRIQEMIRDLENALEGKSKSSTQLDYLSQKKSFPIWNGIAIFFIVILTTFLTYYFFQNPL